MSKYRHGEIEADDVDEDELAFAVDTALSWEGQFPEIAEGDYIVTIGSIETDSEPVLVSRRYVGAIDHDDAARIALDAFAERHGFKTDDEGNILPVEVEGETGIPAWVEAVDAVVGGEDEESEEN